MKSLPLCLAASLSPKKEVSSYTEPGWTPVSQLQAAQRHLCLDVAKMEHLVQYSCWGHWVGSDGYHLHGL